MKNKEVIKEINIKINDIIYKITYEWTGEDYNFNIYVNSKHYCYLDLEVLYNDNMSDEELSELIKNEIRYMIIDSDNYFDFLNVNL